MQEKETDIHDIKDRLIRNLQREKEQKISSADSNEIILAAGELTPTDTAAIDADRVAVIVNSGIAKTRFYGQPVDRLIFLF